MIDSSGTPSGDVPETDDVPESSTVHDSDPVQESEAAADSRPGWRRRLPQRWPVLDIVVAAVLGVAGGALFVVANTVYGGPVTSVPAALYPPLEGVLAGAWLLPAVLGGLVIRRPGAALFVEVLAALVSMVVGTPFGLLILWYGLLQGLGAELAFALLGYRRWGLGAALLAGVGAAIGEAVLTLPGFYAGVGIEQQVTRVGIAVASGIVLAGLGAWALTRALAATGVLSGLRSGRAARRVGRDGDEPTAGARHPGSVSSISSGGSGG